MLESRKGGEHTGRREQQESTKSEHERSKVKMRCKGEAQPCEHVPIALHFCWAALWTICRPSRRATLWALIRTTL